MAKTDDIIKVELSEIGDYKNLKRRGFIGSSNHDQDLWTDGGLTFSFGGKVYGSNDFAWYIDEAWVDPSTGIRCNKKPVLVVEGTHCLNTESFGTAQIQRFHHAYGPFRNGIISVYYLRKGKHEIRHDLLLAAYIANFVHGYKQNHCAYLVTEEIEDIQQLVKLIGDYGETSTLVWDYIDTILKKMFYDFKRFYENNFSTYEEYLNSRAIFQYEPKKWIKFLGPKQTSFTDPSIRYGHIVLGEAFVTHYLLSKTNDLNPSGQFLYYFPLITKDEKTSIDTALTHDKEWLLLSGSEYWRIVSSDEIAFEDKTLSSLIHPFRNLDLNKHRKEWNVVRERIAQAFQNNRFKVI